MGTLTVSSVVTLDAQLVAWIERVTGGAVTEATRQAGGGSREAWLIQISNGGDQERQLFLRRDSGVGPATGTPFTLTREAAICQALESTAIPVPTVVAVEPSCDVVLAEVVPGTANFRDLVASPRREALVGQFIEFLAIQHTLDVQHLDLPDVYLPNGDLPGPERDLADWMELYRTAGIADPTVRAALEYLHHHVPVPPPRPSLLHGDCGPGNFLFDSGRITAIVDWEFAHVGDPLDDIAWLAFRDDVSNGQAFAPDLQRFLARWSRLTGYPLRAESISYYGLLVLVRCAICALRGLARAGASIDNSVWHVLLPRMRRAIAHLLADLHGLETTFIPTPPPGRPSSDGARILETLRRDLDHTIRPALTSPDARKRAVGMRLLLDYLASAQDTQPEIERLDIEDLHQSFGVDADSVDRGHEQLEEGIAAGSFDVAGVVPYLVRSADRWWSIWEEALSPGSVRHRYPPLYRPSTARS